MKKLLILTAVLMLAGASGCKSWSCADWFRGAPDPCPQQAPMMAPACYDPCSNPCGVSGGGAMVPPGGVMVPGPMPGGPGS
jgi:hypothetical protein